MSIVAISYPRKHGVFAKQACDGAMDIVGPNNVLLDQMIEAGNDWVAELERAFKRADFVIVLFDEKGLTYYQSIEVNTAIERWRRQETQILPIALNDAAPPFLLQMLQYISGDNIREDVANWLRNKIAAINAGQHPAAPPPSFNLPEIDDEVSVWFELVTGPDREALREILSRIVSLFALNRLHDAHIPVLRHAGFILHTMRTIVGVTRLNGRFAATLVATLIHNTYLLNTLPRYHAEENRWDGPYPDAGGLVNVVTRSEHWRNRLRGVTEYLRAARSPGSTELVTEAADLATAFFAAFQQWDTPDGDSPVAEVPQDPIRRALLFADLMDVRGTVVPALMRTLFKRGGGYIGGYICFFEHTHSRNVDLGFASSWRQGRLEIAFPVVDDPLLQAAVNALTDVICDFVRTAVVSMSRLDSYAVDLALDVDFRRRSGRKLDQVTDSVTFTHLSWALFPLAIALPASDSDASATAQRLLPRLADYISRVDAEIATLAHVERGRHAGKQLPLLFDVVRGLRTHSHMLSTTVELARAATLAPDGPVPHTDRVQKVEFAMNERGAVVAPDLLTFSRVRNAFKTQAREFFVFGASRPVALWLAQLAAIRQEQIIVHPLYCVRLLLLHSGRQTATSERNRRNVAETQEHDISADMIREAAESVYGARRWITVNETLDFAGIPRILMPGGADRRNRQDFEVVFGARACLKDPNYGPEVVCTFGSHLLSAMAGEFGIPVRVVTRQERVDHPIDKYDQAPNSVFNISYSLVRSPGAEDERVPLADISMLTTERQHWVNPASKRPFTDWGKSIGTRK